MFLGTEPSGFLLSFVNESGDIVWYVGITGPAIILHWYLSRPFSIFINQSLWASSSSSIKATKFAFCNIAFSSKQFLTEDTPRLGSI